MSSAPFGTGRGSSLTGRPPAAPARGPATGADDHGRPLTTNAGAAACYRMAQRYSIDTSCVVAALRGALTADPGFALAAADLRALGVDAAVDGAPRRLQAWERRHVDIVTAAARGDGSRAAALLGEHLVEVGCDPIALVCVAAVAGDDAVRGLSRCRQSHVLDDPDVAILDERGAP